MGKRDTNRKPRLSETIDMIVVVGEVRGLKASEIHGCIHAARRSPVAAHRCYAAILASHGIHMTKEPRWTIN